MAIVGADVEQLHTLARQFREKADQLESNVAQSLSQNVASSPWKGTDAETFRQNWQTDLTPTPPTAPTGMLTNRIAPRLSPLVRLGPPRVLLARRPYPRSPIRRVIPPGMHQAQQEGQRPQRPHRTEHSLPRV